MPASTAEQLKSLWARLNAKPGDSKTRKVSPDWVVLQWEPQGVVICEAHAAGQVTLRRVGELAWGGASNPDDSTASAGSLLKEKLAALKISTRQAAVIVGREAVVLRRLELPVVPDNELPDMVRFQAAAKASTPIDRMALDFIALQSQDDSPLIAVTVTMDAARLKTIQDTMTGAGLELAAISLAATATAELVSHAAPAGDLSGVSLVLLQKGENLELSVLDGGWLAFAHAIRLEQTEGGPAVQPLQAELNRTLVAMSQSRPDASVARVFVIPGIGLPASVSDLLEKRFPGMVRRVDPRDSANITSLSSEESTLAVRMGPAIGRLLAEARPTVPAIDFVNPRRRIDPPDTRRAKIRAIAGGAALLALLGIWMNMNAVADRQQQIDELTAQASEINGRVAKGKPTIEAAKVLKRWKESDPRPIQVLDKLASLLPPTSDLILTDVYIKPARPASGDSDATVLANLKALAWSKSNEAITSLENRLATGGYSFVNSQLPEQNQKDPEYPLLYTFVADQLVEKPAAPAKPSAAVTKK